MNAVQKSGKKFYLSLKNLHFPLKQYRLFSSLQNQFLKQSAKNSKPLKYNITQQKHTSLQ